MSLKTHRSSWICSAGAEAILLEWANQFANRADKVIGIDIDPIKVHNLRHNAVIYDVRSNIEILQGNAIELGQKISANLTFASPPWSGVSYKNMTTFSAVTYHHKAHYSADPRHHGGRTQGLGQLRSPPAQANGHQ
jgi:hypothetical protein